MKAMGLVQASRTGTHTPPEIPLRALGF
jgi:hypothetical protein